MEQQQHADPHLTAAAHPQIRDRNERFFLTLIAVNLQRLCALPDNEVGNLA